MRSLLAVLLFTLALALADPSADATAEATATSAPASELDLVRMFNPVEVFHLDPGIFRTELRFESGAPDTDPTLLLRAELGLTSYFQASITEDGIDPQGQAQVSATHLAVRYSLGAEPDGVSGSPAIEAELIPRTNGPITLGLLDGCLGEPQESQPAWVGALGLARDSCVRERLRS